MAKPSMVRMLNELAHKRIDRIAQLFMVVAFVLGALSGVFVTVRWWGWLLVALLGLGVLLAAFELNTEWVNRQLEVLK